jgi:membrane fusion protein (multidrug efflux system)
LGSISPGTYITPAILVAKLVNTGKLKSLFQFQKNATKVKQIPISRLPFLILKNLLQKVYAIEPEVNSSY